MPVSLPRSRAVVLLLALAAALAFASSAMASSGGGSLYTQTNDPSGNSVQRFDRAADGSLAPAGTFATGGVGLAALGGRQGAVELSGDGRYLYASTPAPTACRCSAPATAATPLIDFVAVARRRAGEHRRAPRPRLRPELRRHAERRRVLAPARRLAAG